MATGSKNTADARALDLSELQNLSLSPNWGKTSNTNERFSRENNDSVDSHVRPTRSFGDNKFSSHTNERGNRKFESPKRSFDSAKRTDGNTGERSRMPFRGKFDRSQNANSPMKPFFRPILQANFYAEDATFDLVAQTIRSSAKTYELFNVAKLFLEKAERFVVVVKKIDNIEDKMLFMCVHDGSLFLTENEAVNHVLKTGLDKYFDVSEEDIEPPSGTFSCVHRCGITGKLICAPNYHRYNEILNRHFENEIERMPYGKFKERVETVNDKELIDQWKAEMSKQKVYTLKDQVEGSEAVVLRDFTAMKKYFVENLKNDAIKSSDSFRILGAKFEGMPRGIIRKSLFAVWGKEKTFPLNLANNLRGKLKKANLFMYKIGAKGISYVCGVKRKFRNAGDVFDEKLQTIVDCIDSNQGVKLADLYIKLFDKTSKDQTDSAESTDVYGDFVKNLGWLISEGFVAEHEDGKLFTTRIIEESNSSTAEKVTETIENVTTSDDLIDAVTADSEINSQ